MIKSTKKEIKAMNIIHEKQRIVLRKGGRDQMNEDGEHKMKMVKILILNE